MEGADALFPIFRVDVTKEPTIISLCADDNPLKQELEDFAKTGFGAYIEQENFESSEQSEMIIAGFQLYMMDQGKADDEEEDLGVVPTSVTVVNLNGTSRLYLINWVFVDPNASETDEWA